MKPGNFIGILFHSRTQAHLFHLKTNNYSIHKTLDNYYKSIIPLVDKFAEAYQAEHGLITNYSNYPLLQDTKKMVYYFEGLLTKIKQFKIKDTYLQNIVDSIYDLIYSTLYLLTLH